MGKFISIILLLFPVLVSAQDLSIEKRIKDLPVLDGPHAAINYQGSIDKTGGNADWDWFIYEDENNEWVLLDVDGAGVIENLVQHRYPTAPDAELYFYIDNEKTPRLKVKLSEIGSKYPFVEPLAGAYVGPLDGGRGPIRVVRSFVPIPFSKHCKVTSDKKLYGNDLAKGESGWGHIVYHTYDSVPYDRYETKESDRFILKTKGYQVVQPDTTVTSTLKLSAGESKTIYESNVMGVISAIRMFAYPIDEEMLRNVWVRITFDNHSQSDVLCPIGALFGNSFGYNTTEYLFMGVNKQGLMYNTFPMPYWNNVSVTVENRMDKAVELTGVSIDIAKNDYDKAKSGYFRNAPYYNRKHTEGADSRIGVVNGYGKLVAAHVTCWAERDNIISCEGDVRVYIDGKQTPSVESDGSESYVCYGWGFPTPSENHPFGGYDGKVDNPWSMTRLLINDSYPFYSNLIFDIESGEHNNQYLEHEGTIFYYSQDTPVLQQTDTVEKPVELEAGDEVEYKLNIQKDNNGISLQRISDQSIGRQEADIYIDGVKVEECSWYYADSNTYNPLLADQFEIPRKYTEGKKKIKLKIKARNHFSVQKLTVYSITL